MGLDTDAIFKLLESLPDGLIYIMLAVSAFVENICPPIPGDTITAIGAFLVGVGQLDFFWVFASTTLGSLAGFLCLFALGRSLGRRYFLERDFRFFRAQKILQAEAWFTKYGYLLVALNRFLPGVRSAVSIAGGISRLRLFHVAVLALLSCGLWNGLWIFLGYSLGTHWESVQARLTEIMTRYNVTVAILGGLFILAVVIVHAFRKRSGRH
jgi:membrane protein DedA with SNARE-associated domain